MLMYIARSLPLVFYCYTRFLFCLLYNSATSSLVVASSIPLSSRTLTRRGKRMLMPLLSSTNPCAALCTGLIVRSAPRTSQTSVGRNQSDGDSPVA